MSRAQNWAKKLGANWLLDIFSRSQHRNLGAIWLINCTYLVAGMQRVLAETEINAFHGSCNQQKCIDKYYIYQMSLRIQEIIPIFVI